MGHLNYPFCPITFEALPCSGCYRDIESRNWVNQLLFTRLIIEYDENIRESKMDADKLCEFLYFVFVLGKRNKKRKRKYD